MDSLQTVLTRAEINQTDMKVIEIIKMDWNNTK